MSGQRGLSVYVIAGEASGDQLGGHLISGLRHEGGEVSFRGVGGPLMAAQGMTSLFPMDELSVMGLVEVLPKLPALLRRISQVADDVVEAKPDVLVTIDSPDFCLRVAKKVKARLPDLKIVHYVAPSVWAWRPKRAAKMAQHVDHVLALLPFEPPFMEAAGMTCDFVGHPIATVDLVTDAECAAFREAHGIAQDAPLLCVLPGSRRGEVTRHSGVFVEVISKLQADIPNLVAVIPMAPAVADLVPNLFGGLHTPPALIEPGTDTSAKFQAFAAADLALAVSGTVSLELAAQSTPMVIAYDASPLTKYLMKRAFLLDTATLVNIVSETKAVPEFIFDTFKADLIEAELSAILSGRNSADAQIEAARVTMEKLGRGGVDPGRLAAQSVLRAIR